MPFKHANNRFSANTYPTPKTGIELKKTDLRCFVKILSDRLEYDPQLPHFILLQEAFELCLVHSLLFLELDPSHPTLSALPLVRNDEPAAMRGLEVPYNFGNN